MKNNGKKPRKNQLDDNYSSNNHNYLNYYYGDRNRTNWNVTIHMDSETGEIITLKQARSECRKVKSVRNERGQTTVEYYPARVVQLKLGL